MSISSRYRTDTSYFDDNPVVNEVGSTAEAGVHYNTFAYKNLDIPTRLLVAHTSPQAIGSDIALWAPDRQM